MRVMCNGQPLQLEDRDLLGQGGEARVYRHGTQALKVFHDVDPALSLAEREYAVRLRNLRLRKLRAFPRGLPAHVVAPGDVVTDLHDAIVGYAMPLLVDAVDFGTLAQRSSRTPTRDARAVCALLQQLVELVHALHAHNVVVGDLNDGNVVLCGDAPWLIDTDSMQFASLPCPVAHERFLDPVLYGRDLLATPCFTTQNDDYALRVFVLQSLCFVHPYGGTHGTLGTLLRRAEAGHSVLRDDVKLPRAACTPHVLPDALLHDLTRCFDQGVREPFNVALLALRWTRCACGVEHARTQCPVCRVQVAPTPTRTAGDVERVLVRTTTGVVLAVVDEGALRFLIDEHGRVVREDGALVLDGARDARLRFALVGASTWVGLGDALVRVEHGSVVERVSCSTVRAGGLDVSAFAASSAGLVVVRGDWLVDVTRGLHVGRVLAGQTHLHLGPALGFAWYLAGRVLMACVWRPGFVLCDVTLPTPRGRIVDVHAVFAGERVLVTVVSEQSGVRQHALHVVDARGRVLAQLAGDPTQVPALANPAGFGFTGERVWCPTDTGVASLVIDDVTHTLVLDRVLTDTADFLDASCGLVPQSDGTLVVTTPTSLSRLRVRKPSQSRST
jgi:hypothetical protein